MRYHLSDSIAAVKGIGPSVRKMLLAENIHTVLDLVLNLPYRYEDRRAVVTIDQLQVGEQATVKATVRRATISYRGRRTMTRATLEDATGKLNAIWFNNRFVMNQLKEGSELYFAGTLSDRGMLVQPTVEKVSDDTVHTARLVPFYSQLSEDLKIGLLRRILKEVTDNLEDVADPVRDALSKKYPSFIRALQVLHFPNDEAEVPAARERLALEELLGLIEHSKQIKSQWKHTHSAATLTLPHFDSENFAAWLPSTIPFTLTSAQERVTTEIFKDLHSSAPMNRILVGEVGSGKTVVGGLALSAALHGGRHGVLIAPTQILAGQHASTFAKLFPSLHSQLVTAKQSSSFTLSDQPTLYIGTHALLRKLDAIQPALIVYDEQHRFGVAQRTPPTFTTPTGDVAPHVLTLSATPIPRTLMLTLFSHLSLSLIDELPAGRQPVTTWLVPKAKRDSSLQWIGETLQQTHGQALIVCPFIEPSSAETLENVAAATETFEKLQAYYHEHFPQLTVGLLHGKLKPKDKQAVIDQTFAREIDVLVTTPVVEVGVDLPAANIMVIEAAERFGLASLHQLRGRVGRAGQESFCLLFSTSGKPALERLKAFTHEHNGLKLAEQDLQHRGAGDLFGFQQHGLTNLRLASWTNLELIQNASLAHQALEETDWHSLLPYRAGDQKASAQALPPGAN